MGKGRFLYSNRITGASMLTASSIFPGTVGSALKEGTGSGTMTPSGAYTGTDDRLYTVEIDLAGDVGTATFRWRRNTSSGWEASGVLTSTSNLVLENGVQVKFAAGSGTDFILADSWTFKAVRFFAPGKLIDLDPDVPWRSNLLSARPALADVNMEVFLPATRNDLLRSEELDNASWTKNDVTISADAVAAPDGQSTADKVVENALNVDHDISQAYTRTASTQQAYSCFALAAERTWIRLVWAGGGGNEVRQWFDVANGVVGSKAEFGSATVVSASIAAVPGAAGWYRCKVVVSAVIGTSGTCQVYLATGDGGGGYLGDGASGLYVWGLQVEDNQSAVRPYLPTAGTIDSRAASFTDKTSEALDVNSVLTGAFWTGHAEGQYFYAGATTPFDRLTLVADTLSAGGGALVSEYYNGSAWTALSGVTDGTASGGNALAQDGDITWTIPTDWAKQGDASLDAGKYYVRLSPTNAFVTTDPNADQLSPSSLPETVTIDLASALQATAVVLHGHNISSGATAIQLLANSADEWGTPAYKLDLAHNADTIAAFIDQTYRYWQVRIADQGNADGYIEIGELFLGTYLEPNREYVLGDDQGQDLDEAGEMTAAGTPRPLLRNRRRAFDLDYLGLAAADRTSWTTLFEAVKSRSLIRSKPFFFTPDSGTPAETYLVHWLSGLRFRRLAPALWHLAVQLEERPLSPF